MTPLQQAEAKLRDLAGYRGNPSSEMALSGEECRLLAEELDALRAANPERKPWTAITTAT